jgi:hypothetical protein
VLLLLRQCILRREDLVAIALELILVVVVLLLFLLLLLILLLLILLLLILLLLVLTPAHVPLYVSLHLALVLLLLPPSLSFPPHAQTNDVLQQLAPLVVGVELLAELLRLTQYLG